MRSSRGKAPLRMTLIIFSFRYFQNKKREKEGLKNSAAKYTQIILEGKISQPPDKLPF
jgi:hypothetical protein